MVSEICVLKPSRRRATRSGKRRRRKDGFTLVEIMIVVSIIALLAAIAIPGFLRARKRSQASHVRNELRLIDDAVAQYAIETNKKGGDHVHVDDWIQYLKPGTRLYETGQDILGNDFDDQQVDQRSRVPRDTWDELSDVAPASFWEPHQRKNGLGPKHKTPR
jgi:prepilin-type N-terminal cleavage/methylation domain-containing protein